jgi:hypothetical protein
VTVGARVRSRHDPRPQTAAPYARDADDAHARRTPALADQPVDQIR